VSLTREDCERILAEYVQKPLLTQRHTALAVALAATLEREARLWDTAPGFPLIGITERWDVSEDRRYIAALEASQPTDAWLTRERQS
jgi:hypothetical protein